MGGERWRRRERYTEEGEQNGGGWVKRWERKEERRCGGGCATRERKRETEERGKERRREPKGLGEKGVKWGGNEEKSGGGEIPKNLILDFQI